MWFIRGSLSWATWSLWPPLSLDHNKSTIIIFKSCCTLIWPINCSFFLSFFLFIFFLFDSLITTSHHSFSSLQTFLCTLSCCQIHDIIYFTLIILHIYVYIYVKYMNTTSSVCMMSIFYHLGPVVQFFPPNFIYNNSVE